MSRIATVAIALALIGFLFIHRPATFPSEIRTSFLVYYDITKGDIWFAADGSRVLPYRVVFAGIIVAGAIALILRGGGSK